MTAKPTASAGSPTNDRVVSIDTLRGFDMFWIMGGDLLAKAILERTPWSFSPWLANQFEHEPWEGFRFYDLIYPLFLFLVGCVIPYSMAKYEGRPSDAHGRVLRRTLLLLLLGMVCNQLLQFQWSGMRWTGVLQRIGISYGIAAMTWLHTNTRQQVAVCVTILLAYWAILAWIPAPGGVAGDLTIEGNLGGYLDRHFLPGKILPEYYGWGDNEGILSTIPAVVTALLGVLCGTWLRTSQTGGRKCVGMASTGLALLVVGLIWGQYFPVIKNLWTSSYVLVAAGWSLLLLSLFYFIIDVLRWRRWTMCFVVIGMNPVTIYVASEFIDFEKIARFFTGGIMGLVPTWSQVILLVGQLTAQWLFLWFLYRHRVFLRV